MRTNWRTEWPHWAMLAAMFLLAAATWSWAPDRLPVHWGLGGEVDRYGGRFEGLLGLPALALGLYLLLRWLPRIDPGRANYAQFAGAYALIRLAALAMLALTYGAMHLSLRGYALDMGRVTSLLLGALFIVLGGMLGKVRPNWFVGVRTPWTLSSKLAWTRTNRLGGWLLIAEGATLIVAGLLVGRWALAASLPIIGGGTIWLTIYSYRVWRDDPDKTPPAGTLPAEEAR